MFENTGHGIYTEKMNILVSVQVTIKYMFIEFRFYITFTIFLFFIHIVYLKYII